MARICCVESCRALPQEDITFFNFPIKQSLQRKWRDAIRPTETLTVESVICSRHFADGDYETVRGKVRLKAKVVPTIFNDTDSPSSLEDKETPKENGHSNSSNTEEVNHENTSEQKKEETETESFNGKCQDTSKCEEEENHAVDGIEEDGTGDSPEVEYEVPVELSCEVQLTEGEENETIECVPESILHEDSDSHSEGDIHKEDIEDIIANYHIKQDPKLAERLKASQEKENQSNNKDSKREDSVSDKESNKSGKVSNNSGKECNNSGKGSKNSGKRDSLPPDKDDNDCVEVSYQPSRKRRKPEYVEIPVDKDPTSKSNDCLMVMEKVEVNIDPSALLFARGPDEDSEVEETAPVETERRNESISLLTSSDEDDVIIEEPHIDTVEVSDETDEDDLPLTRLLKPDDASEPTAVGKILWGTLSEYYCYKCRFTTTKKHEYAKHKLMHEKIFNVCDACDFSTASKSQYARHKRKHKDGKIFNCHLCDYKAKHHMSLIYHLRSHGVDERSARLEVDADKSKCPNCELYFSNVRGEFGKHYGECDAVVSPNKKKHKCTKCKYVTRRPSDLKRHVIKKHLRKRKVSRSDDGDEEYEP